MAWTCSKCGRELQKAGYHRCVPEENRMVSVKENPIIIENISGNGIVLESTTCVCPSYKGSGKNCKMHAFINQCVYCNCVDVLSLSYELGVLYNYVCRMCGKSFMWNSIDRVVGWKWS